jgi:hypothetical protein
MKNSDQKIEVHNSMTLTSRAARDYVTPKLIVYGSLLKLTHGTGGQGADGALGMTMMANM